MKQHVYFIMDKKFIGDIWSLSRDRHIWICNSESNTPKIKAVWEKDKDYSQLKGVTSFDLSDNPLDCYYKFLGTINEHHSGDYPDIEPWDHIAVWGIELRCVSRSMVKKCLEVKVRFEEREDHFIIKRYS